MKKCLAVLLFVSALVLPCVALDQARLADLNQKARQYAQQKDWQSMREVLIKIGQELPGPTPLLLLRMASVESLLGHKAEAMTWISRYAAMGLAYDFANDDELKPLINEKGFTEILQTISRRTQPVMNAEPVCTIPLPDLMPEDIAYQASTNTFITSSVQHHTLYRVNLPKSPAKECRVDEIHLEADAKRWPTLAVKIDAKRNLIWMSVAAMPGFTGFPQEDTGKSALLAVNLESGKIVRRFDLASSKPAVLGDMCLTAEGTIYITDSLGGGVYRVQGDLGQAKLLKIAEGLSSPQTPALAADGKRLFVADYSLGIAVVDLSGQVGSNVTYLKHGDDIAVTGVDGLNLSGSSLIGMQNGTTPERIMRFQLNSAQTEITSAQVVEQASSRLGEATHAVAANGKFYISANVGWDKVDDHGQLKAGQQFSEPMLLAIPE